MTSSKNQKSPQTHTEELLKKASEAAHHYGFYPLTEMIGENTKEKKSSQNTKDSGKKSKEKSKEGLSFFESVFDDLIDVYKDQSLENSPHPLLAYHSNRDLELSKSSRSASNSKQQPFLALHIIGVNTNIGEALIIRTALAILSEMGEEDISVSINSIGNAETAACFDKELISHFKKNLHIFPAQCRELFKKDTFSALQCVRKHSPVLLPHLPKPMQFLTENCRKHLREVIEYLDTEDIPYELEDSLVGPKNCYRDTVFELKRPIKECDIEESNETATLGRGGRYSEMFKNKYGKELPSVGVVISLKDDKEKLKEVPIPEQRRENASVYLIQIGFYARIKSFTIIEKLRKARIPILQSITNDQAEPQIKDSRKYSVSHLIVIGQKEALEDTVIIREVESQTQETVPIKHIVDYLKKLKK